jgi:hypothetical protein
MPESLVISAFRRRATRYGGQVGFRISGFLRISDFYLPASHRSFAFAVASL